MASLNDKITDVRNSARPVSTTVSGTRSPGGGTLACASLTGWPTASKVHFVTYQIDSQSNPIAGTQLDCEGIVSGSNITSFTVLDGTDAGNAVGDVVEMLPTASWGQDLSDGLLEEHNRDGTHGSVTADSLSTDTITESTPAAGVTIDSLNIKDGKLNTNNSVVTANVTDAAITYAKLLSTIFSGQLTTYTNPGTAGGTSSFRYGNIGGIKFFYGQTAAQSTSTSQNDKTVTLPVGFFSSLIYVGATASSMTSEARACMAISSADTTTVTVNFFVIANSGTSKAMVLVIGT